MKINEILPDLEKALDIPDYAPAGRKPTGTTGARKPLRPGQQQSQQTQQQGQQQQIQQQGKPLRPGQTVNLPTKAGNAEFKITRDMGDKVEIENPEPGRSLSEPSRLVYDKSALEKSMKLKK